MAVLPAVITEEHVLENRVLQERKQASGGKDQKREGEPDSTVAVHGTFETATPAPESGAEAYPDVINGVFVGQRPKRRDEQIAAYRRVLAARATELPLGRYLAAHGLSARSAPAGLVHAYVPLDTGLEATEAEIAEALKGDLPPGDGPFPPLRAPRQRGGGAEPTRPLHAMEAAVLRRSQVLLGGPGSGKTTFLRFLAYALATGDDAWLAAWPSEERHHLPILISLREFSAWIASHGGSSKASASLFLGFVLHDLHERNLGFAVDFLQQALSDGEAVLLVDGLDEVPGRTLPAVRDSLQSCAERYSDARLLVTCRSYAYRQSARRLPRERFPTTTLAPFSETQVDRFIAGWYGDRLDGEMTAGTARDNRSSELRQAVHRSDLRPLASNPLLLTLMAMVQDHRGDLPQAVPHLYEEALSILLWDWEQHLEASGPRLTGILLEVDRDRDDLIRVLERLAYDVCGGGAPTEGRAKERELVAGMGEQELVTALRALHPERRLDWAQTVVDVLRTRGGLLLEAQPGTLCFVHRTFQEYLAGAHLAHSSDFAERVVALLDDLPIWHDTILRGVGFLVHNQRETERPLRLAERLCTPRGLTKDRDWRGIWLAGEVLLEIGLGRVRDSELGTRLKDQVCHRLAALVELQRLSERERAEAGDVLGHLGDARFDRTRFCMPSYFRGRREKAVGLVLVNPGPFVMGSREGDAEAEPAEVGNPEEVSIGYRYWIARYPVTVAEYQAFLKAKGYENQEWWAQKGWSWCRSRGRRQPDGWEMQLVHANRPVVGVTWFEAMAYGRWLDSQLRRRTAYVPPDYRVRLPTEAEWERAARGHEGRQYAWGDTWGDALANVAESVGHVTAVGMYSEGATPTGVQDLTGNVWEWCLTRWRDYPYGGGDGRNDPDAGGARVLRGGSWRQHPHFARCACRLEAYPDASDDDIGFRLVLSRAEGPF